MKAIAMGLLVVSGYLAGCSGAEASIAEGQIEPPAADAASRDVAVGAPPVEDATTPPSVVDAGADVSDRADAGTDAFFDPDARDASAEDAADAADAHPTLDAGPPPPPPPPSCGDAGVLTPGWAPSLRCTRYDPPAGYECPSCAPVAWQCETVDAYPTFYAGVDAVVPSPADGVFVGVVAVCADRPSCIHVDAGASGNTLCPIQSDGGSYPPPVGLACTPIDGGAVGTWQCAP